jgi:hypothetical protein
MRKLILAAILPLCVVLAGCATTPQIPYDRMTAGNIKTIGIVTPKFPNRASVVLATTVGQSFGLVGALVDAGLQEGRDSSFEKMTGAQNFVAQDAFMRRLTDTLQEQGYTISNVDTMRPNRDKFLDKYPMDPVDAYLDLVVITYGYIAAGVGNNTPYRPRFSLQVRLVRAGDSSVLMQDTVLYNPYTPGTAPDAVTISPNPAYEYQTFSELESSSEMAIEGLKDAVHQPRPPLRIYYGERLSPPSFPTRHRLIVAGRRLRLCHDRRPASATGFGFRGKDMRGFSRFRAR